MKKKKGQRTRRIRRFVIEEDRTGMWTLRLYYTRGKCGVVARFEEPHNCFLYAGELNLVQPDQSELKERD